MRILQQKGACSKAGPQCRRWAVYLMSLLLTVRLTNANRCCGQLGVMWCVRSSKAQRQVLIPIEQLWGVEVGARTWVCVVWARWSGFTHPLPRQAPPACGEPARLGLGLVPRPFGPSSPKKCDHFSCIPLGSSVCSWLQHGCSCESLWQVPLSTLRRGGGNLLI